jgi:uncharacterized protein (UPF0261 family)
MCNFGALASVPEHYRSRLLYQWNPNVTLMRTDCGENVRIGQLLAETANAAAGPAVVIVPLKGVSMLDRPDGPFWAPDADAACFRALREGLRPDIRLIEDDSNINDPEFADRAVAALLALIKDQARIEKRR